MEPLVIESLYGAFTGPWYSATYDAGSRRPNDLSAIAMRLSDASGDIALELRDGLRMSRLRVIRWKLEAVLAALFLAAAIVTAVIPEWLEALGFEPDNGDGSAEWFIVGVLGLAAAATFVMSMVERRACTALAPSTKGLES